MKTQTFIMYTDMNSSQKRGLREMTSLNLVDKYYEYNWHNIILWQVLLTHGYGIMLNQEGSQIIPIKRKVFFVSHLKYL
jgi:hypothetical protein